VSVVEVPQKIVLVSVVEVPQKIVQAFVAAQQKTARTGQMVTQIGMVHMSFLLQ
jgi:hypothetical protein